MEKIKHYWYIIAIVIIVIIALIIAFTPKYDKNTVDGIKVVQIEKEEAQDTTKKQAIDATIEQFKRIGENVTENDLNVETVNRNGINYYLIRSKNNSIMIEISTGKIIRINNVSI